MKIIQEKFFPNNVKWSEEYIHYLGSLVKEGCEYDLGLWIAPNGNNISWLFVQSNDTGDYQSGSIIRQNKFEYTYLKSKFNVNSPLPIIEILIQAKLQKYFSKLNIKNFNFRSKYIFGIDVITFLINPSKFKNITIYLKRNLTKLTDVIIIEADNHWNNKFFHKGKYYEASDVILIEDN